MGFSLKNHILGGKHFCCCLPVRLGVIVTSLFTLLLSGFLSAIIWFEVKVTHTISSGEKAVFAGAGIVETALFLASVLGFVGAIVKKQTFVGSYATFLWFHLLVNCGVAAYFMFMIVHSANTDIVKACKEGLKNAGDTDQCDGLLKTAKWVYLAVASAVLLTEMYTAIIATRYYRLVRDHKRQKRASRLSMRPKHTRYSSVATTDGDGLLAKEFNPYDGFGEPPARPHSRMSHSDPWSPSPSDDEDDIEHGYGGGQWSLQQLAHEKERDRLSTIGERSEYSHDTVPTAGARDRIRSPSPPASSTLNAGRVTSPAPTVTTTRTDTTTSSYGIPMSPTIRAVPRELSPPPEPSSSEHPPAYDQLSVRAMPIALADTKAPAH